MASLRRELTLFDLTMISIGSTIGSGIFLTPALIARTLVSPGWIIVAWLIGGVMAIFGALSFSELGAMMPKAGGIYVFLKETYGGLTAFLFGWSEFLVTNTGSIAALGYAFATYLGYIIPLGTAGTMAFAIAGVVVLTIVNVLGVKIGGIFSDIFTALKLLGIAGLIGVGFLLGSASHIDASAPFATPPGGLSTSLALALVGVFWSIGGWQHATFTGAEVKSPQRNIPRAMIIAAFTITLVYILTVVAYMMLLSGPEIASSHQLASDAMERVLGTAGGVAIAIAVFVSTFGTTGIYTLTAPRIYYAMALDGLFFEPLSRLHPRFGTPAIAIITQSIWATVLIVFWGTFENLISYVVFTDWIFYGLTGAAVLILRKKQANTPRPYRTVLYPFTPLLFTAGAAWFVVNTLINKPAESGAGILFLLIGIPVYLFWKKRSLHAAHS